MVLDCGQLHQAVGTILLVQVEHPEDQRESGEDTETDTEPPVNTYHIEDDEQQENGQQAPDKKVQVLCLQAVEFHVASDSLVDIVFGYPDVADGKNRLEEEINFSQRFTTALT